MAWTAIEDSIWEDEDVLRWSVSVKLLYIFLSTCGECHWMTGIYRPPIDRLIRVKTGLSQQQLDKARARLEAEGKIEWQDGWLWLVGKGNHSLIGPKQARGAVKHLEGVPVGLARRFVEKYRDRLEGYGLNGELAPYCMDTVSDTVSTTRNPKHVTRKHEEHVTRTRKGTTATAESSASGKGSDQDFRSDAFVRSMEELLGLGPDKRGGRKQYLWDLNCLNMVARHIKAGHLGPVKKALERCVRTVAEIMADARSADTPEIKRPAAVFQKRIAKALEKSGHSWKEAKDGGSLAENAEADRCSLPPGNGGRATSSGRKANGPTLHSSGAEGKE